MQQYMLDDNWIESSIGQKDMEDPSRLQDVHVSVICPCDKETQLYLQNLIASRGRETNSASFQHL